MSRTSRVVVAVVKTGLGYSSRLTELIESRRIAHSLMNCPKRVRVGKRLVVAAAVGSCMSINEEILRMRERERDSQKSRGGAGDR